MTTVEELLAIVASQQRSIERLSTTIELQAHTIADLTEQLKMKQGTVPCPQEGIVEAMEEFQLREKKKLNLVVLKAPEGSDEDTTVKKDIDMAHKLCELTDTPVEHLDRVFRHGPRRSGHPRPIKVCFKDTATPSNILKTLRRERLFNSVLPVGSRLRRDLTSYEQEVERNARRECYELNEKENANAYYVNDQLKVARKRVPTVWRGPLRNGDVEPADATTGTRIGPNVTTRKHQ